MIGQKGLNPVAKMYLLDSHPPLGVKAMEDGRVVVSAGYSGVVILSVSQQALLREWLMENVK